MTTASSPTAATTDTHAMRVFLADDHAVVRDGLRLILETRKGIVVVGEAIDGRDAVHAVLRLRPDVVIMDICMPGMDGIDATRSIRLQCPETQVVILSMVATREHIHGALAAGALGYVLKESAGREVVDAVLAASRRERYLSRRISDTILTDFAQGRDPRETRNPLQSLSDREREILRLVVDGMSSDDIARRVSLSPKTIETYRTRMAHKLGLKGAANLVRFAIEHGLTR